VCVLADISRDLPVLRVAPFAAAAASFCTRHVVIAAAVVISVIDVIATTSA
jgi:hypothetical protein